MIKSFGDRRTKAIYEGEAPKGVPSQLLRPVRVRLNMVASASSLADLKSPPSNNLERIRSVPGLHSIRVNQQFRIVFRWVDGDAEDVALVDYKH